MVLAEDPPADLSNGAVVLERCSRHCGLTGSVVPAKGLSSGRGMVVSPPEECVVSLCSGRGCGPVEDEICSITQHPMQHNREFSGERDLGFAHPSAARNA